MPTNETPEQRADERLVLDALERYFSIRLEQQEQFSQIDGIGGGFTIEAKGRPKDTPEEIESKGGIFVERRKVKALVGHPLGFFVPFFYIPERVAFLLHISEVLKGKPARMDRTRRGRGQDDKDVGLNVSLFQAFPVRLTVSW